MSRACHVEERISSMEKNVKETDQFYTHLQSGRVNFLFDFSETMAKEAGKFDPNTEAFQMRAQWAKMDNCRKQWFDRWSWLLDERKRALEEADAIRQEAAAALPQVVSRLETAKTLKPVPLTSTGQIGWISTRGDCQLEIYTSWLNKIPVKLPDAWENKDYLGHDQ